MQPSSTLYVGLDVHKESIAVAYVAEDHGAEVVSLGTIGTRQCDIDSLSVSSIQKPNTLSWSMKPARVGIGSTAISRKKTCLLGRRPSLIPKKPGDRVKTDRRDAIQLARLMRSGDLTPVYVPRSRMKPSATYAGRVKMQSGISRPPSSG